MPGGGKNRAQKAFFGGAAFSGAPRRIKKAKTTKLKVWLHKK